MNYFNRLPEHEQKIQHSEPVFQPVSEWNEEIGQALFFCLDAGEPPQVTSPISSDWDSKYFTHFMLLPKEFGYVNDYRRACIKSGIETSVEATFYDQN